MHPNEGRIVGIKKTSGEDEEEEEEGNKQKSGSMCVKWVFLLIQWPSGICPVAQSGKTRGETNTVFGPECTERRREEGGRGGGGRRRALATVPKTRDQYLSANCPSQCFVRSTWVE